MSGGLKNYIVKHQEISPWAHRFLMNLGSIRKVGANEEAWRLWKSVLCGARVSNIKIIYKSPLEQLAEQSI